MSPRDLDVLLSIGDIAELADVTRSAVSNWRKRHEDFPAPRVRAAAGSLFDLDEVEEWLLANGKIDQPIGPREIVWRLFDSLRAEWEPDDVWNFAVSGLVYLVASRRYADAVPATATWPDVRVGSGPLRHRLLSAVELLEEELPELRGLMHAGLAQDPWPDDALVLSVLDGLAQLLNEDELGGGELFHDAMSRLGTVDRFAGEHATPDSLAYLMTRLVSPVGDVLLDPAVGRGGLLLMAALATEGEPPSRVVGYDVDEDAVRHARSWFFIYDVDAEIDVRDSLRLNAPGDATVEVHAHTIVLDPPLGLANWGDAQLYATENWPFGAPSPRSADLAWPQVLIGLLRPGARAAVVLPEGAADRPGRDAAIRHQLIESGHIEAVIQLPPRMRAETSIGLTVWLLTGDGSLDRGDILLIDARSLGSPGRAQHDFDEGAIDRVTRIVRHWRSESAVPGTEQEIAVAVPPSDLRDATLLAAPYLPVRAHVDTDALRAELTDLATRMPDAAASVATMLTGPDPGRVDEVELGDFLTLLVGHVAPPKRDDNRREEQEAVPLVDVRTVSRSSRTPERLIAAADATGTERLRPGDVAIALIGQPGAGLIIDEALAGAVLARDCVALRVDPGHPLISRGWLHAWVQSEHFKRQVEARTRGSGIRRVSRRDLAMMRVPIPAGDFQDRTGEGIAAIEGQLQEALDRVSDLERLRAIAVELVMERIRSVND